MHFEHLESLYDEITQVRGLALRVVNLIALVQVLGLEEVEDGQDLAVVRHEGLTDGIAALDKLLENVECACDDFVVTGVKSR